MFISLNKKILYSLTAFLVLLVILFFVIFTNLYAQKLKDSKNSVYLRNQYVVSLLYDNVRLQKYLTELAEKYPNIINRPEYRNDSEKLSLTQRQLFNEQKLNEELHESYNDSYEAIVTGAKIVGISIIAVVLLVLMLLFLLDYWVIVPVEHLINISDNVSSGILSNRLKTKNRRKFKDEFDILYTTFNNMLDNMEKNIAETKIKEKFLQQLIDAIPDGIRVIDKDYNIVMANKAAYSLLNIKDNCVGKKCYIAYGYECEGCPQSRYNCPIKELLSDHKDLVHTIHEVGKIPLYVNAAKLKYGDGPEDFHVVEAIHDLSSDVRFSHQQKVSSLAFLSTSIAHEMKNNLGAIRLIMEGILNNDYENTMSTEEKRKYLQMAYNQLIETVKTPERLLKLAQYSENETDNIEVSTAVKDMMQMIDYDAKRKGINIVTDIEPNLSFIGNESDFKMIILNLAQNAIKAMPDGGELRISGEKSGRMVVLNVKDTGIGIEEDKIKHIFEPFYSANSYSKSSGLGLAIVSSLIEKAKGSIYVKSKIGKGTRFTVRLPVGNKKTNKLL